MEIALAILSGLFLIIGLLGAILPVLPGPILSWVGILILHFTDYAEYTTTFLVVSALIVIAITVLDYFIPIWGTKKFGGTKAGVTGSTVGLIVGLFFPPLGLIIGPFAGALIGEILANRKEFKKALKSATGSFLGFLVGTGLKLIYCGVMIYYFFVAVFSSEASMVSSLAH
ncbi:MAG TPA: DUF456 domain-containing protein [Cryomorphaceae bacterium]|nr:DUF456 domain-containing protein [Cryomorphaceae bacterium]